MATACSTSGGVVVITIASGLAPVGADGQRRENDHDSERQHRLRAGTATGPLRIKPRQAAASSVSGLAFAKACSQPGIVWIGPGCGEGTLALLAAAATYGVVLIISAARQATPYP
jgi:hypothetical protein